MKTRFYPIKPLLLLLLGLLTFAWANAVTVKLKITYNGQGVAHNDITIKVGDMSLGKGRTDQGGNVSINCSTLPSRGIDVYGSVVTNNGSKTWDVKGWVALDDNYYGELRFEDVFNEMGLPAGMFAEAWGLTFSTGGGSASGGDNGGGSNPVARPSGGGQGSVAQPAPMQPAQPSVPPGYKCMPLSAGDFSKTKRMVEGESFDSGKADAVASFFRSNCYDAAQARELIALITFESTRLDLAKKGYKNCANQGMYLAEVSPALEMSLSRDELRDYINGEEEEFMPAPRPKPAPKPVEERTAPAPKPKPEPAPAPAPNPNDRDKLSIRTENGEPFIAYLEGVQINQAHANDVMTDLPQQHSMTVRVKVTFEDRNIPTLEKKVLLTGVSDYYVFIVKKNEKGEWVIKPKL